MALFILAAVASSLGQTAEGFGRFGYTKYPAIPGFTFSDEGFKTKSPGSDAIRFKKPLKTLNRVAVNPWRMVALTDGGIGMPSKLRFDIADFGFSMYFPAGIELKVNSTAPPYVTWKGGSGGSGVPTPDSDWVGLSFQDRQPPIIVGFPEDKSSLEVTGELGNWTIKSPPSFKGWIRIALPFGSEPYQATTAQAVGRISERCAERELMWVGPMAEMGDPSIAEDKFGLTVTWRLPRQRTILPNLLYYAQFGNYPLKIQSLYTVFPSRIEGEPVIVSSESELRVRFPIRHIPNGRGLSIGELLPSNLPTEGWVKPTELVSLALNNTLANRRREVQPLVRQLLSDYYEANSPQKEPNTKLSVFYDVSGKGMLNAAVHSLLTQSNNMGDPESPSEDPQFISLAWRQDPYTGSMGVAQSEQRRVLAIASLAGAFSSNPEHRLAAAMMEAALSAEGGRYIWRRRQGLLSPIPPLIEPLLSIRKGVFSLTNDVRPDPVLNNWFSELRAYTDAPVWLNPAENTFELCWDSQQGRIEDLVLISPYQLNISSKRNISGLFLRPGFGRIDVRYESAQSGISAANLLLPDFAERPPLTALPPLYSEVTQ